MNEFDEHGNYKMTCAPGYDDQKATGASGATHFADDATLDYIAKLERENAELRAEVERKRPVVEAAKLVIGAESADGYISADRQLRESVRQLIAIESKAKP